MQKEDRGRLRWRRALPLFLSAGLGMLLLNAFLLAGVLPQNLSITGQQVKLTSNGRPAVAPEGLSTYIGVTQTKNNGPKIPTLMAHVPEIKLSGLCMSLNLTFPVIGSWTIQLHSTKEVVIKDINVAASDAHLINARLNAETNDGKAPAKDASNVVSPVELNKNASDVEGLEGGAAGLMGVEGRGAIYADELRATNESNTISGTANLTGLGIPKIGHGKGVKNYECY
ncbi:MAG: DUF6230 family protein [Nocardiaceae bacterium]|nr:DUF6230 family protein [Nocardiaceae bacterium]